MRRFYRIPVIGGLLVKLPPWAMVLLFVAVSAGAGTAPMVGGVTGEANTVVEQAVTVSDGRVRLLDRFGEVAPAHFSGVFVLNTDGISFTAAISLAPGDQYAIDLALANASLDQSYIKLTFESEVEGFTATAILICQDHAVEGGRSKCGSGRHTHQVTAVAPSGPSTFIVQIEPESPGTDMVHEPLFELRILVNVGDTVTPGFHKASLNLTPIKN